MADDDEDPDYGAPPHLSFDGDDDPRLIAMLKERLAKGPSGPPIEMSSEELVADIHRRGMERLKRERDAA